MCPYPGLWPLQGCQATDLPRLSIWEDSTVEPPTSQPATAATALIPFPTDKPLMPAAGLEQTVCEEQAFSSGAVLQQWITSAMTILTSLKTWRGSHLSHPYSVVAFPSPLCFVTCISCPQHSWSPSSRVIDLIKINLWDQESKFPLTLLFLFPLSSNWT